MGNLIQNNNDDERVLKIELPDGTEGEIPIQDATQRGQIVRGDMLSMIPELDLPTLKEGGVIKEYDKGEKVRRGWVKKYEDSFKTDKQKKKEKIKSTLKKAGEHLAKSLREKRESKLIAKEGSFFNKSRKKK